MNKSLVDRQYLKEAALSNPKWFDKPMRYGNLTLAENDPGRYPVDFWLDFIKKSGTECITLSAGGIVSYYPTEIPYHYKSNWLVESDPFGELMMGCRRLGLSIIARVDSHAMREDAAKAHPEWLNRDEKGNPRKHWANPDLYLSCCFGPYAFDFIGSVMKEIMSMYYPDAVFANRWEGSAIICYCESCQKSFNSFCGMDLPSPEESLDPKNPKFMAYAKWLEHTLIALWKHWDSEVKKISPTSGYSPNMGGAEHIIDMKTITQMTERVNVDKQARWDFEPMWSIGRTGKKYYAFMGTKPCSGGYSIGPEVAYRWKDAVLPKAELKTFYADGLLGGLRPSWGKFSGILYDRRWIPVIEDIFKWHKKYESYFRNTNSLSRIGVIWNEAKRVGSICPDIPFTGDHELGVYQALTEARIPFDLVHEKFLELENISKYKLLILPNFASMSKEQVSQIRAYVDNGGSLLATYQTSLYNDEGTRQENFQLADIFGVDFKCARPSPVKNSYLTVERSTYHPILEGLDDTDRIMHGVYQLEVVPRDEFGPMPFTLIPSYPDLPMEDVYPRIPHTDIPEIYLKDNDKNRIAYFPWDIDRSLYELNFEDHYTVLKNTVKWALNEPPVAEVIGSGMIDMHLWAQEKSIALHIVNHTNPLMYKGPCREILPLSGQLARIKIPDKVTIRAVKLLASEITAEYTVKDGYIEVNVPDIYEHEVLAVDLE